VGPSRPTTDQIYLSTCAYRPSAPILPATYTDDPSRVLGRAAVRLFKVLVEIFPLLPRRGSHYALSFFLHQMLLVGKTVTYDFGRRDNTPPTKASKISETHKSGLENAPDFTNLRVRTKPALSPQRKRRSLSCLAFKSATVRAVDAGGAADHRHHAIEVDVRMFLRIVEPPSPPSRGSYESRKYRCIRGSTWRTGVRGTHSTSWPRASFVVAPAEIRSMGQYFDILDILRTPSLRPS